MAIIAMTREMGSRGRDVALGLSDRLGLEVVHHELVERDLAQRMHLPESQVHRYLEGHASLLDRWNIDRKRFSRCTVEEILELATHGNVLIRGWGAAQLLRDIGRVLIVRVCAPMQCREKVVMERMGITDREAVHREIKRNDAAHTNVIEKIFAADWRDSEHYDIVLNTERLPINSCVDHVAQLASRPAFQETEASQAALADKLFEVRIRNRVEETFGNKVPVFGVYVNSGKVVLSGKTHDHKTIEQIEQLAREIAHPASINNSMSGLPRSLNGA